MSAAVAPPGLPDRFASILNGLRRHLAIRAAKDRAFAPLLLILWNRLSRTIARFAAIAARHQAGTSRPPRKPSRPRTTASPPPPRDPLPRERGWLLRRAPESVAYAEYFGHLLDDSEMTALIEAAPQLRRLLRPLWRMLHLEPRPPILQIRPLSPDSPKPCQPRAPTRKRPGINPPSVRTAIRRLRALVGVPPRRKPA